MTPAESYLADLYAVRGAGTAETSGYPALASLLNEIGGTLKPKITTVIHPSNSGAGLPDGGFFSAKELRQHPDEVSLFKLNPERGVLEVKPVDHDLLTLAQTPQVRGYLEHYGQILLTNYRSFALYSWEGGKPVPGESFFVAESVSAFWDIARNPREHPLLGERLTEYLRRALLNRARLAAPRDLAAYLASYAREARARVEGAATNALAPVSEASARRSASGSRVRRGRTSSAPLSSRRSSTASSRRGSSGMKATPSRAIGSAGASRPITSGCRSSARSSTS